MKVYVIISGEYSDMCICGVVLSRDVAEAYVRIRTMNDKYPEIYNIEEYDTDDIVISDDRKIKEYVNGWVITFSTNGNVLECVYDKFENEKKATVAEDTQSIISFRRYIVTLYIEGENTPDEKERCIRIAQDKRASLLADMFSIKL